MNSFAFNIKKIKKKALKFYPYFWGLIPLSPRVTGTFPKLYNEETPAIRSVVFDIYGTLLISASGDIGSEDLASGAALSALMVSGVVFSEDEASLLGQRTVKVYLQEIQKEHERLKRKGIPHPEVDILKIWDLTVALLIKEFPNVRFKQCDIELLALGFEFESNPVSPMPGMDHIIRFFKQNKISLGIVSNAQFYTPILMNFFLHKKLSTSEKIKPFIPELSFYSYKIQRAKPDHWAFDKLKSRFKKMGIKASEVLFVGNDMLKDVYPAAKSGFQTALFAGDTRSLKFREEDKRVEGLEPDYILTELYQLSQLKYKGLN